MRFQCQPNTVPDGRIARVEGALVIVRPDQYVAHVLPLEAHAALADFFGAFLLDRQAGAAG